MLLIRDNMRKEHFLGASICRVQLLYNCSEYYLPATLTLTDSAMTPQPEAPAVLTSEKYPLKSHQP